MPAKYMNFSIQAPVVQGTDNFIHQVNTYPVDTMYSNQYILSVG